MREGWKRGRGQYADQEKQEEEAAEKERPSYEFRGGPAREMRIASRLTPWKANLGPKPGERSWPARLSPFLSLSLFLCSSSLLSSSASTASSSHSREAAIAFLFCLCCAALRCSLSLSLSHPLSLSLFFVGRKWFMAVPERRFRRGSCAEDRPLLPFILRLSSWSCHFIRHASSLRPPRSRAPVFLRGIPFFMHAIASFTFLTRRNGISVFYRLDYTTTFSKRGFFAPVEVSLLYNGRQNSVWPNNAGAVYHGSRKSIFEI